MIAEHKRRSPSAGVIRADLALEDVVGAYERGGAAALSILTEGPSFGGSLDDLRAARAASALPILRKDFIVDPYQLHEALAAGADAILLIVAALRPARARAAARAAASLGLAALVEVHDERELERRARPRRPADRDQQPRPHDAAVDIRRTFELLPGVPAGTTVVAGVGLQRTASELDELERGRSGRGPDRRGADALARHRGGLPGAGTGSADARPRL